MPVDVWRPHWWQPLRWWILALLASGLLGTVWIAGATLLWAVSLAVNAAVVAFTKQWRTVPVGAVILVVGFGWFALFGSLTLVAWAVWRTLDWWRTVIILDGSLIRVRYGIITRTEVNIPPRKFSQAQWHQHPLGMVLGFGEFRLETAGQVEFVDRVRWAPMGFYDSVRPLIGVV